MKVVVIHQSRTGNTRRAAELIGGAVEAAGNSAVVRSASNLDYKELAQADLVFVGTWVDGLILFGHRPGDLARIRRIPPLWDKHVAAFMTHAVHPGDAVDKLAAVLVERGARVLDARSLHRRHLEEEVPAFVEGVLTGVDA